MGDYLVAFFVGVYLGMMIGILVSLYATWEGIKKAIEDHDRSR
jgi:ABC-type nitrate/sulfonate/bicarbonate transport system permease component